jgi:serine O-acetyltransferase
MSQNVTLGWSGGGKRGGTPIIGNDVHIAPGANISGKIRIGNNARIGANAVVSRNVPDNTLVQAASVRTVTFLSFYDKENRT